MGDCRAEINNKTWIENGLLGLKTTLNDLEGFKKVLCFLAEISKQNPGSKDSQGLKLNSPKFKTNF